MIAFQNQTRVRFTGRGTVFAGPAAMALLAVRAANAQDMSNMPGMKMPGSTAAATAGPKTSGDMAGMEGMDMGHMMTAALGPYPITREASGTSWQPDNSEHQGIHVMKGDWMLMFHADLNGVYDTQSGPRGGDKSFLAGMIMGMAKRSFLNGDAVQFRAMLSPEPFMGARGYPLLLATGETADGVTPLTDRQHPHDLFMELSGSYSHKLTAQDSVFIYGGLPGEPAFGPPAFMHRMSIMDSPEAPISHHWLDSTHITFGVVTAGFVHDDWKIEASQFHGREPDQYRYNIETGALDSTAVRLSWNPLKSLALQTSWAHQVSPEQLAPNENQNRWSASALYTVPVGKAGWSTTAAWGRRRATGGAALDAYVLESAIKPNGAWTIFARAERTDNDELVTVGGHAGPPYAVSKASVGAIHDWPLSTHVKFGVGGLYAMDVVPSPLKAAYGSDPHGAMAFVRLKIE